MKLTIMALCLFQVKLFLGTFVLLPFSSEVVAFGGSLASFQRTTVRGTLSKPWSSTTRVSSSFRGSDGDDDDFDSSPTTNKKATDEYDAWLDQLDPTVFEDGKDEYQDFSSRRPRGPRTSFDSDTNNNNNNNNNGVNNRQSLQERARSHQRDWTSNNNNNAARPPRQPFRSPPSSSSSSRGGGGGRGGGGPPQRHDYQRDWQADDSRVDEAAVDQLISQRLQARKTGQFDLADSIRDTLLQEHGVGVRDKERLWRSGCSPSGSGRQWGQNSGGNDRSSNDRNSRGGATADRGGRRNDRRGGAGGGDRFDSFNDNRFGRQRNNNNDDYNRRGDYGRREPSRGGANRRGPPPTTEFGPHGHDYSLSPDAGPSISDLSEDEIHALLAERLQCKLARQFRRADDIQQELYTQSVYVHDGIKEWRADGVLFDLSAPGFDSGRDVLDMNRPYTMSPYSLPLRDVIKVNSDNDNDEDDETTLQQLQQRIQELIKERLELRMDRKYSDADAIRDDLRQDYNVEINDRKREWSVGGIFDKPLGPYEMSPYSLPLSSLITDLNSDSDTDNDNDSEAMAQLQGKIQSLVEKRIQAKQDRDYTTADAIRDELLETYNVIINDRERLWSIGGMFEAPPEPYQMSSYSKEPAGIDVEKVNDLCVERDQAREQRAFAVADDIKFSLLEDYNIVIDDKRRQWSVGGKFDETTPTSSPQRSTSTFTRRGGGSLSEETIASIEELLAQREEFREQSEYGKADRVREKLVSEFKVLLDDRNQEWHVVSDQYVHVSTAFDKNMDPKTIEFIQNQVNQRALAKLERDFEMADSIRDALSDEFGVWIDDRIKEWFIVGDRSITKDANDSLINGSTSVLEKTEKHSSDSKVEVEEETENSEPQFDGSNSGSIESEEADVEENKENETENVDMESLENLTVVELKDLLRSKGLPVSGRKMELIERLQQ